jgi:hypothetical protein
MANLNGQTNGLFNYDSFKYKKTGSNNFLWWCAGAEQELLIKFPTEHTKYSGLGGVLLATFVLAALAAGYALFSIFGSLPMAIFFAVVWGLIIFNFDRFLVSTMRKYGVSPSQQLKMAIPRILLAILIGVTIARPLELKIFEKEINVKVQENMHKKMQLNDSLLLLEQANSVNTALAEKDRLQQRKTAVEDTLHSLQLSYVAEADGTGGSGRRGIEKLTRLKMEAFTNSLNQYSPELAQLASGIKIQDSIIANNRAATEIKRKKYEASIADNVGFLERNKALSDLSDEESSVFWTSVMLSLLIILIEAGPVLSKLIMQAGPYDVALGEQELTKMAESENDMRRDKSTRFDKNKKVYENRNAISSELLGKLTDVQKKYIKEEIEHWENGTASRKKTESLDQLIRRLQEEISISEQNLL